MECGNAVYSDEYYDLILDDFNAITGAEDICQQKIGDRYTVYYFDRRLVPPLSVGTYKYSTIPRCFTILDQLALEVSGITKVQSQRNLALKGRGILIGFIDTGIRFENSAFRNTDGSSRIVSIWDQTRDSKNRPKGFIYGTEYKKEEIDRALSSEKPREIVPEQDEIGHGTMLASIAAGSEDTENDFIGAAPYADIAVVKLKPAKEYLRRFYYIKDDAVVYQENDILAAAEYLENLAKERNQPFVLCMGLGTNQGDHGGGSRLADDLDDLSIKFRHAVCVAVGNEANARHHFYGNVRENSSESAEINVTEKMNGFVAELWGRAPAIYSVSIHSPTGEILPRVPVFNGQQQTHRFLLENTTVRIDYQLSGIKSRDQLIYMEFQNPAAGIWTIEVFPNRVSDGGFHIYLPISGFLEENVYFIRANPDITLTVPSGAALPMAVGGYDAATDAVFIDSGRGYSMSGMIKPDYIAPAVNVYGQNHYGRYDRLTGTSAAAAVASGASALLLEWNLTYQNNQTVNSIELKNQIINGTRRLEGESYPNRAEGNGRLDIYQTLLNMRNVIR